LLGTRSSTTRPETSPRGQCPGLELLFFLPLPAKNAREIWHWQLAFSYFGFGPSYSLWMDERFRRRGGSYFTKTRALSTKGFLGVPNTKGHHPRYLVLDINLNPLFPILAFQRATQANSIPNTSQTPIFCHEYIRPLFALALALLPWYVVRRNGCSASG
jgi:hypothetical protein